MHQSAGAAAAAAAKDLPTLYRLARRRCRRRHRWRRRLFL